MTNAIRIAGDGIGKDVTAEAVKVLTAVGVFGASSRSSICRGAPITI
jgi:isocitrate/isopropylmalate dehydrogenase